MDAEFCLSRFDPAERFEFWHDFGSLVYRPVRCAYHAPSQMEVSATLRPSDSIVMGRMNSSEQYFERTRQMIKSDHVDSLMLVWLKRGCVQWTAEGSAYHARAGDVLLLDNHEISHSAWSSHQQIYAVLPRDLISLPGWQDPGRRVLRSASPCAAILRSYLRILWESQKTASQSSIQQLAHGLASLVRLYFSDTASLLDTVNSAEPLKETIQRWIKDHLNNPDLGAAQICSTFFISRSALYELYKPEGGVRTYLQKCRLERARLSLANPDCQASISAIASSTGFRSLASFTRSFRDHWGMTPTDARRQALALHNEMDLKISPSTHHADLQQVAKVISVYYKNIKALSALKEGS